METMNEKQKMPTPQQRPDLYDDYDYGDKPADRDTGIKTPDHIQKIIDERKAAQKK